MVFKSSMQYMQMRKGKKDLIGKIQDGVAVMCPIHFTDVDKMRLE